jgi:periplasmic divalent cation tolerance protein
MTDAASRPDFPAPAGAARVLLTSAPPGVAREIAAALVGEGLAACVSLLPGVRSVYRWEGAVRDDPETVLLVKTRVERLAALSARIVALHPYELPEQLVLEPSGASAAYVAWLEAASRPPAPD